jgi:hypothetical protein
MLYLDIDTRMFDIGSTIAFGFGVAEGDTRLYHMVTIF